LPLPARADLMLRLREHRWCGVAGAVAIPPMKGINCNAPLLETSDLLTLSFLALLTCLALLSAPVNPPGPVFSRLRSVGVDILATAAYRTGCTRPEGLPPFGFRTVITFSMCSTVWGAYRQLSLDDLRRLPYCRRLCDLRRSPHGMDGTADQSDAFALLQFAYISYYVIPPCSAPYSSSGQARAFEEALFASCSASISPTSATARPGNGPRFTLSHSRPGPAAFPFLRSDSGIAGRSRRTRPMLPERPYPVVLMSLYYAWKEREKILWQVCSVVTGLIISTVYLRYHLRHRRSRGIALTGLTIALAPGLRRLLTLWALKGATGRSRSDRNVLPRMQESSFHRCGMLQVLSPQTPSRSTLQRHLVSCLGLKAR